jgi:membrane glycosyltransferase
MRLFVTETMDARRLGRRRFFFFSSIFAFTSLATWFMADILWRNGLNGIEIPLLILFPILFAHVAAGFCTALLGLYVLNRGGDSSRITATRGFSRRCSLASTAIVMPVFNEDVSRVFEGPPRRITDRCRRRSDLSISTFLS